MSGPLTGQAAKARAEAVERDLARLVEEWQRAGPDHTHHIHHLFAELYLCTTRNWLAVLDARPDSDYAWHVMHHFFAFYRQGVVDCLDRPEGSIVPHWRRYHRMARRQTIRSPISAHLMLISVGAWAHTRHDLGAAMRMAEADPELTPVPGVDGEAADRRVFGRMADRAFSRAAHDYVALHRARQRGWRRFVLGLCAGGLVVLGPLWLGVFRLWRLRSHETAPAPGPGAGGEHGTV